MFYAVSKNNFFLRSITGGGRVEFEKLADYWIETAKKDYVTMHNLCKSED